jgi:hypothetical protein
VKQLLAHAPTDNELARMYWELAKLGAPGGGAQRPWPYKPRSREELISLASEMCRYDARLLTILVSWLRETWGALNPLALRVEMRRMRSPQAACVVLSFVRSAPADAELRKLVAYVCSGIPPARPVERFFFDSERPGSRLAERHFGRSLLEYSKWGYIGLERPQTDVFRKTTVGRYDRASRVDVLRRLAKRRGEVALSEYLAEIDGAISRPQAVKDARAASLLLRGTKRGGRWAWPVSGLHVAIGPAPITVRVAKGEVSADVLAHKLGKVLSEPDEQGWIRVRAMGRTWQLRAAHLKPTDEGSAPARRA